MIINLARRSEAEGREVARVIDPEKAGIDVEQVMEEIKTKGESSERRRR